MLEVLLLLVCISAWNTISVDGATNQNDASALKIMYSGLNSPPQLTGWSANGDDPCGQSWKGVTCSNSAVTEIKLSGLGLTGSLGYLFSSLTSLTVLDFSNNNLGNQLPYQFPPNIQLLNLAGNVYTGSVPYSIVQMTSLKLLNLGHNRLEGSLPDFFSQFSSLSTLDLSFNNFTGDLPDSFSSLSSMSAMFLQNNQFTGTVDVLANLPLQNLNVANNRFSGWIPSQLKEINNLQTGGNPWSSGPAPPPPPYTPPPSRKNNPGGRSGGDNGTSNEGKSGKKSGIGGGGIAGIVISLVVVGAIIAFFFVKKKSKRSSNDEKHEQDRPFTPLVSNEVKEMKSIQTMSSVNTKPLESSVSLSLKPPPIDRLKSFDDDDFSNKPPIPIKRTKAAPISANVYSIADLQMATGSFSRENLIGEGSIGRVYRAQFDNKFLAVKKIDSSALPNQDPEEFLEAVSNISRLNHPNVAELIGYCSEHGQHLLVYEFHKNGCLHDYLHLSDEYSKPLTWSSRVKISLGTARALEYLHEVCSPSVIHKNFKSANILLDIELNPHLSDCGLSSFIANPEHQAFNQNTSSGYTAPEVAMTGQYTMKSDVYSFGVVMLELLTGRKPFDSSRPRSEQSLVRWATPQLHDIDALDKMVDPALEGLYPPKSLSRFADVVALCVQPEPEFRPPMSEVVQALVRLVQRANMSKRTTAGDVARAARRNDDQEDIQDNIF